MGDSRLHRHGAEIRSDGANLAPDDGAYYGGVYQDNGAPMGGVYRPTSGSPLAVGNDQQPVSGDDASSSEDSLSPNRTLSNSSDMGSEISWISWFCGLEGNEYFVEVEVEFIEDEFNLTGLSQILGKLYEKALEVILDIEPDRYMEDDPQSNELEAAAEVLYGLIHARYIISRSGLSGMVGKFRKGEFGRCPRVFCERQRVLPVGLSDFHGYERVRLFCPRCQDIYEPPSSIYTSIDGAFFGTTFPHLLLNSFPELRPPSPTVRYVPRIFGYKIHKSSPSAPKVGWLREGDVEYGAPMVRSATGSAAVPLVAAVGSATVTSSGRSVNSSRQESNNNSASNSRRGSDNRESPVSAGRMDIANSPQI